MIINDLINHYERLLALGKAEPYGWSIANVPYALVIDHEGVLQHIVTLGDTSGKRITNDMAMPQPPIRGINVAARYGCDNAQYLLADPHKGDTKRAEQSFLATRKLYHDVLDGINNGTNPYINAVLAFVDRNPQWQEARTMMGDDWEQMVIRNYTLMVDDTLITEVPSIKNAWTSYITQTSPKDIDPDTAMVSLVDGTLVTPAPTHPKINGVRGGNASGSSLISSNNPSNTSYGHTQNTNSPMSAYDANAYTTAINMMLKDWRHVQHLDDTSILTWADADTPAYADIIEYDVFGNTITTTTNDDTATPDEATMKRLTESMHQATAALAQGKSYDFDGIELDANKHCSMLGIIPQAGRISIAWYMRDTMQQYCTNITQHQDDMRIAGLADDKTPTPYTICKQTINGKSKNAAATPSMRSDLINAILTGGMYPISLIRNVQIRIRAERTINPIKAAIIKAYYLRLARLRPDNPITTDQFKEILTVSLNKDSTYTPYVLGRMFAVYERMQTAVNPNIKATIKDKYFTQAAATPAMIFPIIGRLIEKRMTQLKRDKPGMATNLNKELGEITDKLPDRYPKHLTLDEQSAFQLGYYQQRQYGINAAIAAKATKAANTQD